MHRLRALTIAAVFLFAATIAHASVALLMEEPFAGFGAFNPTGHAATYLNHICADGPTRLRHCRPGEYGSVISRYHKVDGKDWVIMPLVPYLYSVETVGDVPLTVDKQQLKELRETYYRAHLTHLVPPKPDGSIPDGEWIQLVGSSLDRSIHGFMIDTTTDQDDRLIAHVNDQRNDGHFNLLFHNCADFSRVILDIYFPHAIHRNYLADFGIMTPKQAAKSLVKYSKKHPELKMTTFVIQQVPGSIPRSHKVDGVAESLIKSKKYLVPLAILNPEVVGGVIVDYMAEGRLHMPSDAQVFHVGDMEAAVATTKTTIPPVTP